MKHIETAVAKRIELADFKTLEAEKVRLLKAQKKASDAFQKKHDQAYIDNGSKWPSKLDLKKLLEKEGKELTRIQKDLSKANRALEALERKTKQDRVDLAIKGKKISQREKR